MGLLYLVAAGLLSPNVGLIVWITISFLILLALLRRFAWGPITSALTEREHRIADAMQRAEKALAEAKQIQADNDRARREAEQEAQRILREAREAAEHVRTSEVEKTRAQIQHLQQQAQDEIGREKQAALEALRTEVADLAIRAAEKVVQENLDAPRQRKIVETFLEGLKN
jgi:F-type H+-transporting ATPase subunit b